MKKILTFLLVLSLCSTSFAQIRERTSQWADNTDFELGAALEVNLAGRTQFRGTDLVGNDVSCMGGGALYSKQIKTNTLGYNLHAAILLNHGGVFVKFRPRPVVQDGYGPQFSTWTLGLVWGLGM